MDKVSAKQQYPGPAKRAVPCFFPTPMGCIPAMGRLLLLGVLGCCLLHDRAAAQQVQADRIKNFKIPEYEETSGKLESIIYGTEALFNRKTRVADIQGLKIEIYKDDKVDTIVTSPTCVYDQAKGIAQSKDDILIRQEKLEVTGTDYTWKRVDQVFRIEHNARVVLRGVNLEDQTPTKKEQP